MLKRSSQSYQPNVQIVARLTCTWDAPQRDKSPATSRATWTVLCLWGDGPEAAS